MNTSPDNPEETEAASEPTDIPSAQDMMEIHTKDDPKRPHIPTGSREEGPSQADIGD